nr:XRE family transcriptional regulator [Vibrio anguillarum]
EDEESAELVVAISKLSIEKRRQLLQFIANMPEDAPLPK